MMIQIQDNVYVNTDHISVIQISRTKDKKIKIEVIVGNRSYIADQDKVKGELSNFLRGRVENDTSNQFVSL